MKKTFSDKLIKLHKINSAEAFLLGNFTARMSSIDLKLIQKKNWVLNCLSHFIEWGKSRTIKIYSRKRNENFC